MTKLRPWPRCPGAAAKPCDAVPARVELGNIRHCGDPPPDRPSSDWYSCGRCSAVRRRRTPAKPPVRSPNVVPQILSRIRGEPNGPRSATRHGVGPRGGLDSGRRPARSVPAAAKHRVRCGRVRDRRQRVATVGCDGRRDGADRRARRRVPSGRPQPAGAYPRVPRAVLRGRAGAWRRGLAAARPRRDGVALRHHPCCHRRRDGAGAGLRGGPGGRHAADGRGASGPRRGRPGHPAAVRRLVRADVSPDPGRRLHVLRVRRGRRRRGCRGRVRDAVRGRDWRRFSRRHEEGERDAERRAVRGARPPAAGRGGHPRRGLRRDAAGRADRSGAAPGPAVDVERHRGRRRQRLGRRGGGRRPRAHGLDLRLLRAAARVAGARRQQRTHRRHRQQRLLQRPRLLAAVRSGGRRRLRLRPARGFRTPRRRSRRSRCTPSLTS